MKRIAVFLVSSFYFCSSHASDGFFSGIMNAFADSPKFGVVTCLGKTPDQCAKEKSLVFGEVAVRDPKISCGVSEGVCKIFVSETRGPCSNQNIAITSHDGRIINSTMQYSAVDKCRRFDPSIPTVDEILSGQKPQLIIKNSGNTGYPNTASFSGIWKGDTFIRIDAICRFLPLPSGERDFETFRKCQVFKYGAIKCGKDCRKEVEDNFPNKKSFPY